MLTSSQRQCTFCKDREGWAERPLISFKCFQPDIYVPVSQICKTYMMFGNRECIGQGGRTNGMDIQKDTHYKYMLTYRYTGMDS